MVDAENMSLTDAIEATEHLTLRELSSHVHVGPLPIGCMTPATLPLKELLGCFSFLKFLSIFPILYAINLFWKIHHPQPVGFDCKAICLEPIHQAFRGSHLRCPFGKHQHWQFEGNHSRQSMGWTSGSLQLEVTSHLLCLVSTLRHSPDRWQTVCLKALLHQDWQGQGELCCQTCPRPSFWNCLGLPQQATSL